MSSGLGPNEKLIGQPGSRAQLYTPALVIDLDVLEHNIAAMAARAKAGGHRLRPHSKTHKSLEIARRQIAAGAVGQCCTTLGEAEVLVGGGITGVLITSPVVTPIKIAGLMALNHQSPDLTVVADNPINVAALEEAAATSGKDLSVAVDLNIAQSRTGTASIESAVALARQIGDAPHLRFAGVQAYAGHLQHLADAAERKRRSHEQLARVAELVAILEQLNLKPSFVSGAGTGTHAIDPEVATFTELQVGSYVFMDVDYWRALRNDPVPVPFETSLFLQVAVVSTNAEPFVTTDGGLKSFATDGPFPDIARGAPEGCRYEFFGDEHGRIIFPDAETPRLVIGDRVECVTPHCDPTVNLHDVYHCVRGDALVEIWPIDARGRH